MRRNREFIPPGTGRQPEAGPAPVPLSAFRNRMKQLYRRFQAPLMIAAGILLTLAALLIYSTFQEPPQRLTQEDIDAAVERSLETLEPGPSFASQAYEVIRPSLVRIHTVMRGEEGGSGGAVGTGVVITEEGIILTSLHVVDGAEQIHVIFADGSDSAAEVLVEQPENDLAVLMPYIIPDDLLPATLSASATLNAGDEVFAVGNPFGISNSLSAGVVSGLNRSFQTPDGGETLTGLIQFDAAVNPGNSGGPLVNRRGEVVGIVSALLNPAEEEFFIGIGFAVPIETAAGAAGSPPI